MRSLGRWWVRGLLYIGSIAAVAWSAYQLGYRHAFGPRPVDSEKDLAAVEGMLWAGAAFLTLLFAVVIGESLFLLLRRPSKQIEAPVESPA